MSPHSDNQGTTFPAQVCQGIYQTPQVSALSHHRQFIYEAGIERPVTARENYLIGVQFANSLTYRHRLDRR